MLYLHVTVRRISVSLKCVSAGLNLSSSTPASIQGPVLFAPVIGHTPLAKTPAKGQPRISGALDRPCLLSIASYASPPPFTLDEGSSGCCFCCTGQGAFSPLVCRQQLQQHCWGNERFFASRSLSETQPPEAETWCRSIRSRLWVKLL